MAFSSISTSSATPRASAPPLPPSPITVATIGTRTSVSVWMQAAMALLCPRSSDPMPGSAPGRSMKVTIGRPNFSACRISRRAL